MTGGGGGALADLAGAQRSLYSVHIEASCFLVTLDLNHFQTTPTKLWDAVLSRLIPNTPLARLGSPTSQMSNNLSKTSSGSDLTGFASVPQQEGGSHAVNITMCCSGVRSPETPDWQQQQQQQRDADCGDQKGGLNFSRRTGLHVKACCVFFPLQ